MLEQRMRAFVCGQTPFVQEGPVDVAGEATLAANVAAVSVELARGGRAAGTAQAAAASAAANRHLLPWRDASVLVHLYKLAEDGAAAESVDEEGEGAACLQWELPNREFEGQWASLCFDTAVKQQLLDYCSTAMLFSERGVDANLVACNRVALLHGPPGTGKTTLCRALAQKLAVRLRRRFAHAQLVEVNAHSLFSKWFSESGKLVLKLFERVGELVDDRDSLVVILVDEVESLAAARQGALNNGEPSDAVRVVNAVLTQIDRLRRRDNVLLLATSNITAALDVAFLDRADLKLFIGLPNARARFHILRSCVAELARAGIVALEGADAALPELAEAEAEAEAGGAGAGAQLLRVAEASEGLSGRALRKLPVQAHAFFLQSPRVSLPALLDALAAALRLDALHRQQP
jgi:MoxR-like ATPase